MTQYVEQYKNIALVLTNFVIEGKGNIRYKKCRFISFPEKAECPSPACSPFV